MKIFLKDKNLNLLFLVPLAFVASLFCLLTIIDFDLKDFAPGRSSANPESDAIAVRILENPNHYKPSRWYKKQDFKGDIEKLTIDGYRAVRSGRTTYVNVGNVEGGELHTYIYLLSYSQNVKPAIQEVYKRMINNWKFNSNLDHSGQCSVSDIVCRGDNDCPRNYICQTSGNQEDKCLPEEALNCQTDSDCPSGLYCDSEKSQVTRDTRRLADMAEIREFLEAYKENNNGKYPYLSVGTYLPHKTMSVWPSWQQELGRKLGLSLPEPEINTLGACNIGCCPGTCPNNDVCNYEFDPRTCWDDVNKWFSDPTPGNDSFNLPPNSYAYYYENTGSGYILCAPTESGYTTPGGAGNEVCSSAGTGGTTGSSGAATNQPPNVFCGGLSEFPHEEFEDFVVASDPDGDAITDWEIDTSVSPDWDGWSNPPELQDANLDNSIRVYASEAGYEGVYTFEITATDSQGNSTTESCAININSGLPIIDPIPDQTVDIGDNLNFLITASESTEQYPLNFSFFGSGGSLNYDLLANEHDIQVDHNITDVGYLDSDYLTETSLISVVATDSEGDDSPPTNFELTVVNNEPEITTPLTCETVIREGYTYPDCQISTTDPEGHEMGDFTAVNLPSGMSINSNGVIYGIPTGAGSYNIDIYAEDEYGAESDPASFELQVNNYCGDDVWQAQNTEGRGGPTLDGREDCDRDSNVASLPINSAEDYQYDCTTPPVDCPPPGEGDCYTESGGETLTSCTHTGGWCGDNVIQDVYGEICDQGIHWNCAAYCDWSCMNPSTRSIPLDSYLGGGESVDFELEPCVNEGPGGGPVQAEVYLDYSNLEAIYPENWDGVGIVFVNDTSGSMTGSKIANAKSAIKNSIDEFNHELLCPAQVGLVEFTSSVQSTDNLVYLDGGGAADLKNEVDDYTAGGGTDVGDGIAEAHQMLDNGGYDDKIMIVMSDGLTLDESGARNEADSAKSDITIYSVAFGSGADQAFMDYIATDGSTSYSGNNINQMYSDISESIIQQVGSEINVTLDSITRTVNVQEDEIVYFSGIGCDPWNYRDLTITNNFQGDGEGEVYYEKVRLHICRTNPWTTEAGIDQLCLNCDYFECGVNPDLCGGQTADCGSCVGDRNHCIDGFCECNNPRTCAGEGVECGYINDGCGDQIYCGPCADYPNSECVSGTCQCNPYTSCSALSCECGVIGDGCGGDLNCSDCASPYEDCSECQCESNPCEFGSSNFGECLFQ